MKTLPRFADVNLVKYWRYCSYVIDLNMLENAGRLRRVARFVCDPFGAERCVLSEHAGALSDGLGCSDLKFPGVCSRRAKLAGGDYTSPCAV